MNNRIQELIKQSYDEVPHERDWDATSSVFNKEKFAELIMSEAFRAGMLYSAKKYANVSKEQFTGNDVAMFLEMEANELSDEDINQHFGIKE